MNNFDTNIENYTLAELMAIVELDTLEPKNIVENTNYYIQKYKNSNPRLSVFFSEIQSQLLQYAEVDTEDDNDNDDDKGKIIVEGFSNESVYPSGNKQVTDWYKNEHLTQSDENQNNKIGLRKSLK